jgi:hypothetical protein
MKREELYADFKTVQIVVEKFCQKNYKPKILRNNNKYEYVNTSIFLSEFKQFLHQF